MISEVSSEPCVDIKFSINFSVLVPLSVQTEIKTAFFKFSGSIILSFGGSGHQFVS